MYYIYIIRCKDNSLYTGITKDLDRRIKEHISKNKKCAKYTLCHTAINLEMAWVSKDRKNASKLEYWIKKLSKNKKEELIKQPVLMASILGNKINVTEYIKLERRK